MKKKIVIFILCLTALFLSVQPISATAASDTPAVLVKLLKKFPHLAYWNHVGSPQNNPDGVTNTPCPTHVGCSWEPGACTCNSFANAIQCMGFAYKAAFDIVGTDPRAWEKRTTLDAANLCVGDIIRYRGGRHSLCVTGIKGNVISFVDANWLPMCQIRWASMDLNDMPSFTYVLHDPNNKLKNSNIDFYLNATTSTPPSTPTPSTPSQEPDLTNAELWKTTASMNLRKSASLSSNILSVVPSGAKIAVKNKKISGGYLWGKATYSNVTGWIALNYCTYSSGTVFAPTFRNFSEDQPRDESFMLQWNAVSGVSSYTLQLFDEDEKLVKTVKTDDTIAACKLSTTGTYRAVLTTSSTYAPSWSLKSKSMSFAVRNRADITAKSMKFSPASVEVAAGSATNLNVVVTPYCATTALTWSSSKTAIATVSGGVVSGKKYGKTTITAKDKTSGCCATCTVTVTPPAPKNLRQDRAASGVSKVALKWAAVSGVDGYFVYRQQKDGSFKYIATTAKNSYKDSGRSAATKYVYKVKAYLMINGEKVISEPGNAATGVTSPTAVKNLTVTSTKEGKVTAKWTKNAAASFYIVYRHTKADKGYVRVTTVKKNTYTDTMKSGTLVYYKVRAVKTVGKINYLSNYSKAVGTRTK